LAEEVSIVELPYEGIGLDRHTEEHVSAADLSLVVSNHDVDPASRRCPPTCHDFGVRSESAVSGLADVDVANARPTRTVPRPVYRAISLTASSVLSRDLHSTFASRREIFGSFSPFRDRVTWRVRVSRPRAS